MTIPATDSKAAAAVILAACGRNSRLRNALTRRTPDRRSAWEFRSALENSAIVPYRAAGSFREPSKFLVHCAGARGGRIRVEQGRKHLCCSGTRKCRTAGGHFEEHCSQAEYIGSLVEFPSSGLLGGHVPRRAHHTAGLSSFGHPIAAPLQHARKSEVHDFRDAVRTNHADGHGMSAGQLHHSPNFVLDVPGLVHSELCLTGERRPDTQYLFTSWADGVTAPS